MSTTWRAGYRDIILWNSLLCNRKELKMGLIITYAFIVILGLLLMNFCRIIADIVDFGEEINASILISIIMSVFIMFTIFKMIGEVTNV